MSPDVCATFPRQKSEKALGAMPEGPFSGRKYQFLDCAEFENMHCLSIEVGFVKLIGLWSQISGQIAILKLDPGSQIFRRLLFKYFFEFLDGFLNFA
jgi:hypothetical protein